MNRTIGKLGWKKTRKFNWTIGSGAVDELWYAYFEGMLLPTGGIFVKKVTAKITSDEYIKTLREHAIPIIRDIMEDDFVIQQDNCSVHVSSKTLEFLERAGIEVLPWPRRRPDENLIGNVWGLISSPVYDGPQPTSLDDLCQRSDEVVNYYNLHCKYYSEILYTSLNKLFLSVVTKKGTKTDYRSFLEVNVLCSKKKLAVFVHMHTVC